MVIYSSFETVSSCGGVYFIVDGCVASNGVSPNVNRGLLGTVASRFVCSKFLGGVCFPNRFCAVTVRNYFLEGKVSAVHL